MRLSLIIFLSLCFGSILQAQTPKDTVIGICHTYIYFGSNDAVLDSLDKNMIKKFRDTLPGIKDRHFIIEAHTDQDGSVLFNQKLSEKRAASVQTFLESSGIQTEKVSTRAFGKLLPYTSKKDEEAKAINRRVKVSLAKKFKLKLLRGKLNTLDGMTQSIKMVVANKIYKDSIWADKDGHFAFWVPMDQKLTISATSDGMYAEPITLMTKDDVFTKPISIDIFKIQLDQSISLKEINFEGDRPQMLPESIPSLTYLLQFMKSSEKTCFEVAGHINQPGVLIQSGPKMNLSIQRAKTVYDFLIKGGIDPKRMKFKGYSNAQMKFPNPKNEDEQKANRRVEIVIRQCND
jgi:outer membrane protein OmpA-like peptidoglycan-associated protein